MLKTTIKKETENLINSTKEKRREHIVCPICGTVGMQYSNRGNGEWDCLNKECLYSTSDIPSPYLIIELVELKNRLNLIQKYNI